MSEDNQASQPAPGQAPSVLAEAQPPALETSPAQAKKKPGMLMRCFLFLVMAALATVVVTAALNIYMVLSTRDRILALKDAQNLDMDCVMVMGAGLKRDGSPSPMLADRLQVGLQAYGAGAAPKLLMTGDHGHVEYDEVNAMKAVAVGRGVPSSDVFMDHAGFSTYESMYRARDIFAVKKAVIVTQHYHLYRAIYNAQRMGIDAVGIPSDLHKYPRQRHFDIREYFARVKDVIWGIFQPYPTYLGDAIPVSGDGDLTND